MQRAGAAVFAGSPVRSAGAVAAGAGAERAAGALGAPRRIAKGDASRSATKARKGLGPMPLDEPSLAMGPRLARALLGREAPQHFVGERVLSCAERGQPAQTFRLVEGGVLHPVGEVVDGSGEVSRARARHSAAVPVVPRKVAGVGHGLVARIEDLLRALLNGALPAQVVPVAR